MAETSVPKELEDLVEDVLTRHFERVAQTSSEDHRALARDLAPEMARLVWQRGEADRLRRIGEKPEEMQVGPMQCSLAEELIREYRMGPSTGTHRFRTWVGRLWLSVQEACGIAPPPDELDGNAAVGVRG